MSVDEEVAAGGPRSMRHLLELQPVRPDTAAAPPGTAAVPGIDTFVGTGLHYPWGGLYGGHIVAQALAAAARTVHPDLAVHSLRAYFIRRGEHTEQVHYDVDRIRDGRSFATRRVVARQAPGAILNLESSFQRPEPGDDVQPLVAPRVPGPDGLESRTWSDLFDRRVVPVDAIEGATPGSGRWASWLRVTDDLEAPAGSLVQHLALAYLSDDLPTEAVIRSQPRISAAVRNGEPFFNASLDHTVWFHRPMRADRWHLHDFTCETFVGGRGLAVGHVFDDAGVHVATIAQEVLVRVR